MDSKKLPLEEEKERYEEFLKELESIGVNYSLPNERTIIILRDSISKFLDRFVSEKERDTFKSKMRTFTVIACHETEIEKYQRYVQDYVSVFNSMKEYLQSSIKAMEYALKTDYLREKSDADRREIVLDRKTKGSSIETVEGLREENKRLRKQLSEAESKGHQVEVKSEGTPTQTQECNYCVKGFKSPQINWYGFAPLVTDPQGNYQVEFSNIKYKNGKYPGFANLITVIKNKHNKEIIASLEKKVEVKGFGDGQLDNEILKVSAEKIAEMKKEMGREPNQNDFEFEVKFEVHKGEKCNRCDGSGIKT